MLPDMGAHRLSAAIAARSRNQGHSNDGTQPELSSSACASVCVPVPVPMMVRVRAATLKRESCVIILRAGVCLASISLFTGCTSNWKSECESKEVSRVEASEISRELLRVLVIFASTHAHTHTYGEVRVRGMGGRSRYLCGDRGQRGYRLMNHAEILRFVRHEAMSR